MNRWAWALLGIAILAIALRSSLLFLLFLFLAFIAGATLLWARVCLTGVSYRRRFGSERLFHGEETDLYVEIVNAKPLPLAWLHIADEFPRALTVTPARTTTSHRPGRQRLDEPGLAALVRTRDVPLSGAWSGARRLDLWAGRAVVGRYLRLRVAPCDRA